MNPIIIQRELEREADPAYQIKMLRLHRNQMLTESDWTQFADAPLSSAEKAQWATYRQKLRDLPQVTVDPKAPVWPEKPKKG